MNNLIKAWQLSPGKVILLILGCSFEFSNFQNLTFEFMQQYRPLWGELNQLIAVFGAGFLILGIVEYGMSDDEDDQKISWGLALVAMAFSYVLYDTAFKEQEDYWSKTRFVQVILSVFIPSLVAYNTHSLYLMVKANEQPPVVQEKKSLGSPCQCGCGKYFDSPEKAGPNPRKYHPDCTYKMKKQKVYDRRISKKFGLPIGEVDDRGNGS